MRNVKILIPFSFQSIPTQRNKKFNVCSPKNYTLIVFGTAKIKWESQFYLTVQPHHLSIK